MVCKVAMPSSAERTSSTTAPAVGSTVQAAQAQHPVSTATRARSSSSAPGRKVRRRPSAVSDRSVSARAISRCQRRAWALRSATPSVHAMSMLFVMSLTIVVKVRLMSSQDRSMTIGAVAAQAGRRPSSIRYYEQIGLLPRPDRVSGRRVYGPDTVRTLAVIETGQRAGLTLDEIRDLLSASDGDQAAIERLREVALRKLPEVRELIERTEIVRDWLEAAARCECPTLDEGPLFDAPALLPQRVAGFSARRTFGRGVTRGGRAGCARSRRSRRSRPAPRPSARP